MSTTSTTTTINSASNIQADYMKLLITQLQNQDPTSPMDNNQMSTQLTMFSELQQLEALNTSFTSAMDSAQRSYANSLLGKEVSFTTTDDSGTSTTSTGIVSQVSAGTDGGLQLTVGSQTVALADVLSVQNASSSTTSN